MVFIKTYFQVSNQNFFSAWRVLPDLNLLFLLG